LVELLERKFPTFYIKGPSEIVSVDNVSTFDIHQQELRQVTSFLPRKEKIKIIITSGASCPDALVDNVIKKLVALHHPNEPIEKLIAEINL
jgi:4-hydroxy-3-methylbut-2-enyl diphosphate reductase